MKKIIFPMLAAVAIFAAPAAYAQTTTMHEGSMHAGSWVVLRDWSADSCYATDRAAGPGESMLSGPYSSETRAQAAIGQFVGCNGGDTGQGYS